MKIGILDTDGGFKNDFFINRKITIIRKEGNLRREKENLTHAEYVCSLIFRENPDAEIILIPVIHENRKCSVLEMCEGIDYLIKAGVDIINLSIGDEYKYHKVVEDVCRKAWKKNILIVAAHSNNNVLATYPASFSFVLGIKCDEGKSTEKILQYNKKENNIIFSTSYFSAYHLGRTQLIRGNSFACAKVTGILSHYREYESFFMKFTESKLNLYYPYITLKKRKCIILTNRVEEPLEQLFISEILNASEIWTFEEGLESLKDNNRKTEGYEVIFIDHDCYNDALLYKDVILQYILKNVTECVLRYPLFSLSERIDLEEKRHILIQQFFI